MPNQGHVVYQKKWSIYLDSHGTRVRLVNLVDSLVHLRQGTARFLQGVLAWHNTWNKKPVLSYRALLILLFQLTVNIWRCVEHRGSVGAGELPECQVWQLQGARWQGQVVRGRRVAAAVLTVVLLAVFSALGSSFLFNLEQIELHALKVLACLAFAEWLNVTQGLSFKHISATPQAFFMIARVSPLPNAQSSDLS